MASAYVVWNRAAQSFVGGAQPQIFALSADAQQAATDAYRRAQQHDKLPKPIYDVVTVTVA